MAQRRQTKACRMKGVCKRYLANRGFGFITCDDGSGDVFVHQSEIHGKGFRFLIEGMRLEFDIRIQDDGRRKAVNVTSPDGGRCQPPRSGDIHTGTDDVAGVLVDSADALREMNEIDSQWRITESIIGGTEYKLDRFGQCKIIDRLAAVLRSAVCDDQWILRSALMMLCAILHSASLTVEAFRRIFNHSANKRMVRPTPSHV